MLTFCRVKSQPEASYRYRSIASPTFAEVGATVEAGLGIHYTAAVVRIDLRGKPRFCRAYGRVTASSQSESVFADTCFDVASITKLFVTSVALDCVARGQLDLDTALHGLIPEWRASAHAPITLRMLLAHNAGFRSGADYRTLLDCEVEAFALREPLITVPNSRVVYSDLGFIALGIVLARARRCGLAQAVIPALRCFGASRVQYAVGARERLTVPATECDPWRGMVQGTVHDEKAHLLHGVVGHAGLFAEVADVARLGEWYAGPLAGRRSPLDPGLARLAVCEAAFDPVLRRGLGWALKTTNENSCGTLMSHQSFGHTGFTGTSIWVDPLRDLCVVLLTNAVHVARADLRAIRARVNDAAVVAVDVA